MEENTNANSNAAWGNMSWGNTPPYWMQQQRSGSSAIEVAALALGIVGTIAGFASGGLGLGLFNRNGQNGQNGNGGPNIMDRLAAVEAQVAVNTASGLAAKELTAALIENAKKDSEIKILQSERLLGMLDYNIALLASSHADTAKQFNLIDAQGNVNLDCAECMVRSLPFPITYGVISISKEDAERVISNIKAGEGKK